MDTDLFLRISALNDSDLAIIIRLLEFGLLLQETEDDLDTLEERTLSFGKALIDERESKNAHLASVFSQQGKLIRRKIA